MTTTSTDAPMIATRYSARLRRTEFRAYPNGRDHEDGGAGAWYGTREQAQRVLDAALAAG